MRRLIALSTALVAVAVACGVPGPGAVEEIDDQDVPWGLASTTSTSTTSTTSTTTTTIPLPTTTLVPMSTTTTIDQTTTTVLPTEPTDLFFVSGGGLFRVPAQLVQDADVDIILAALLRGPDPEISVGLRSAIPEDAVLDADVVQGVVVVDVPAQLLDELSSEDLRLMFGQIVMTFTSPRCIGQVRFTFDGTLQPVLYGDFNLSEPGQALSCSDYSELVTNDATVSPTTVPPTQPTTAATAATASTTSTASTASSAPATTDAPGSGSPTTGTTAP